MLDGQIHISHCLWFGDIRLLTLTASELFVVLNTIVFINFRSQRRFLITRFILTSRVASPDLVRSCFRICDTIQISMLARYPHNIRRLGARPSIRYRESDPSYTFIQRTRPSACFGVISTVWMHPGPEPFQLRLKYVDPRGSRSRAVPRMRTTCVA